MGPARSILIWSFLTAAIAVPLAIAAASPLLAWRQPVYVAAGLAGIAAMALLLVQPLLAGGSLPGLPVWRGRRVHRVVGAALVGAVGVHVAGLWITSPPDMIDALLFVAPAPFSAWGVIAMWAILAAALLAVLRRRVRLRLWRLGHTALIALGVGSSVVHALLIEGTMGSLSKAALCALALGATAKVVLDLKAWKLLARQGT